MADAFETEVRELAGEINQQMARVREAYGELSALEHEARSADEMVSVTAGRHSQTRAIELNPRVYLTLSPSQLADAVMRQVNKATAAVSEQSNQLLMPLIPEGTSHEELFREHATLDAFLPCAVEPVR
ncbi:YbaB/EbfC family nucleoid-associated protein [Streptosporangium sp. NBC_01756]|uniref:YbaB/EbfC family nucleoid-associated protein n=1 Tax=Streptosporangium sp. NBC_01756 TaxID=2975950 RepID=UPI002DDB0938|nr:YbaB/EbfC family nucleoid-associated protein [Streptosporangium sp. NBC_01756]WSC88254.1 YbaB/EbfC family nucleoid-associated protein [Streptosporangium sp. NBC_01756]